MIGAYRQHTGLAALLKHAPEAVVGAVDCIGEHEGTGRAFVQQPRDHLADHGGLGSKYHIFRHPDLGASLRIARPGLRQIELPVDQRVAPTAGISGEHADLAVLVPSCRTGILPPDANRMYAFLQKSGLVDDENAIVVGQRLQGMMPDMLAQHIRRPA